ncbi:MAG: phosphoribosyl-AMP cyclohydrolase [Chromatiales bacterium]|nr:phosphoribosyl-AMP cyclohydrolase [Chromatiales bacterium]
MTDAQDYIFTERKSVEQVEEGTDLSPKFNADGLLPVVTSDYKSGKILMHGYMNKEALLKTIKHGEAYYWSRSRECLWHKGDVSGLIQKVKQLLIDDDQDALWMRVEVVGDASCHVGYRSCFYREIPIGADIPQKPKLRFIEKNKAFDPDEVYRGQPNPTVL